MSVIDDNANVDALGIDVGDCAGAGVAVAVGIAVKSGRGVSAGAPEQPGATRATIAANAIARSLDDFNT